MTPAARLLLDDLRIDGYSRAGDATWFRVRPPGIAFDVGRGDLRLTGVQHLFISHGHLDHALGLPFVLSYRTRHGGAPTEVYCPVEAEDRFGRFVAAAEAMEGADYDYELRGLEPGDRVAVGGDHAVEAFSAAHGVACRGYHLFRRVRRLAPEHRGRAPRELAALRADGVQIETEQESLEVSYCADSGPDVFELEPRLFSSRVLLVECTFLAPGHEDRAQRYGHMHLGDLAARSDRFENRVIVLHHLSRRHTLAELEREVERLLPDVADRIRLLGPLREEGRGAEIE